MRTLGVGLVGWGFIGKVHAQAHLTLPLLYDPLPVRTRLVGVATATPDSGRRAVEQARFEFATTNYRELLSRPDIDLIHVCTPNDSHREIVLAAIEAGKHIYCDKPLALNVNEASDVWHAVAGSRAVHQMTFNYRFVPAMMRARELAEAGFLGEIYSFRAAYLHAGYIDPARPFSWRTDFARSGGGAIADLGAHVIDLLRYITLPAMGSGGEIDSVSASLQTLIRERRDPKAGALRAVDVDDLALVRCRLAGGAMGTLEASRVATGVQDELTIEIHGSRGAVRFNLMDPNWLQAYDATKPEAPLGGDRGFTRIESVTRYPKPYALGNVKNTVGWLSFHSHSVLDFLANVARYEDGQPMDPRSPSFADGLAVQRVIAACQSSSLEHGAWVSAAGA